MEKLTAATRSAILRRAGLVVLPEKEQLSTVSPKSAWLLVTNLEVQPNAVVDEDHENYLDQVNEEWVRKARENDLFGSDGSFLISISGPGSFELPWAPVRLSSELRLAQELVAFPGQPEFVAMSNDARVVCGVTSEENGIWIVVSNPVEG